MASTASLALPLPSPIARRRRIHNSLSGAPTQAASPRSTGRTDCLTQAAPPSSTGRRDCLLLLTATVALSAVRSPPAAAQDIPLFGLRKKIEKAEKQAEELVREGFETAEKGIETAEKGIESAERGIEAVEKGIEAAEKAAIETAEKEISFSGIAQAGVVAGAEFLGVLVATSVVNGILGPEPQKS